jgi:hypothetical protein
MDIISKTLVGMSPGQFDMKAVAAKCGNGITAHDAGIMVKRLDGSIISDVAIRVLNTGRHILVFLHNH